MSGPVTPPLTVSDVADGGSVTGRPITTIEVTDGTLTVSGRTATITTGGGGGSGTVTSITAAADTGTGTAITTSGTFTFTGGTGVTTSVTGTTVTIDADNNGTVTGTGADDQLAVWTSASAIEGDANLTWDGSTLTVVGALDIDNIKIDGNTISSTDTNGAIDLSPDGAGVVTMYNAYRFPTAVTASNDYVLTAQTDGTTAWAEVSGGSGTVTSITPAADSGSGTAITSSGTLTFTGGTRITTSVSGTTVTIDNDAIEGTAVLSTGETGGTKFLREDGDNSCSWQTVTASVPDPLLLSNGDVTDPTYSFSGDTDTGMYLGGTNILNLGGGGADFLEMQHDGTATDFRVGTGSGAARITADGAQNLILQTNDGTNSGTITIQQGANSDLLIEPDGTGLVSFYTGANAWTIENSQGAANQVLTTDGAGVATWEDAGGGGNEYNVELCGTTLDADGTGYGVFDIMAMPPYGIARFTTVNIDSKQYFFPFISPFSGDLATLYYNITAAAGSATNLYLAVYEDNEGVPGDVMGYATIDATVSGSASTTSFSSSIALVRGTQFWCAYNKSSTETITMRAVDSANCPRIAPSSGFPSTTSGYATNMTTNSDFSAVPADIVAAGLEPGVVFGSLGYKPHLGFAL